MAGTFGSLLKIDSRTLAEVLRGRDGPVARDLLVKGQKVRTEAKRLVGVSKPDPGARGAHTPGRLRDSIVTRIGSIGGDPVVYVGSPLDYAALHHQGTRAHVIEAKPGKVLRFSSHGTVVFARSVQHPGTKPNHYLTNAVRVLRGT